MSSSYLGIEINDEMIAIHETVKRFAEDVILSLIHISEPTRPY